MHRTLERKEIDALDCLEYFSLNRDFFSISIKKMSIDLKWSRRNLIKNLNYLQNEININNWSSYINFTFNSVAITFEISSFFSITFFKTYYIEKSIPFKLCIDIFNGTFVHSEQFSKNNFISTSTLYRRFKKLQLILQDFDINMSLVKNGAFIGKEHQIRLFLNYIFTNINRMPIEYSEDNIAKEVDMLIQKIKQNTHQVTYSNLLKVESMLFIAISRIKKGYVFEGDSLLPNIPNLILTKETMDKCLRDYFSDSLKLTNIQVYEEIRVLHFMITVFNTLPLSYFKDISHKITVSNSNLLNINIEKFIKFHCEYFNVKLSVAEHAHLQSFLIATNAANQYVKGGSYLLNIDLELIADQYPLLQNICNDFFLHLELDNDLKTPDSLKKNYLLLIYNYIKFKKEPLIVCMLSKVSDLQHVILQEKIKKSIRIPIDFVDYPSESVNVYISDFKIKHIKEKYPQADYYCWDERIILLEWNYILEVLSRSYYEGLSIEEHL